MSQNNGIIRIGRKGLKKFAFGEDGAPFEVDVVVAFQEWIVVDDNFRPPEESGVEERNIPLSEMASYNAAAVEFVKQLSNGTVDSITVAEARDFLARLREAYDELTDFFRPKSRQKQDSLDTSEVELRFSVEESEQS